MSKFHVLNRLSAKLLLSTTSTAFALTAAAASAQNLPAGFGDATNVSAPVTAVNTMTVDVSAPRAYAEWSTFDVASGFNFVVTNTATPDSYIFVNRVTGGAQTDIFGTIAANGNIWLLNPTGIVVGNGAVVDVGGLLLSTATLLNLEDETQNGAEFLNPTLGAFLNNNFRLGGAASVVTIQPGAQLIADIGAISMISNVINFAGTATAQSGEITLAGAQDVLFGLHTDTSVSLDANLNAFTELRIITGSNQGTAVTVANGGPAIMDGTRTVIAAAGMADGQGNVLLNAGGGANSVTFVDGDVVLYTARNTSGGARQVISGGNVQGIGAYDPDEAGVLVNGTLVAPDSLVIRAAGGTGSGSQDLSASTASSITIENEARGIDIALQAGGAITTGALTARDDIVVRANGTAVLGAMSSGATVGSVGGTDALGAADSLAGAVLTGRDVDVVAAGVVAGATTALGNGSDVRLDGGASGIGNGSVDLSVAAGGNIGLANDARGRDIALTAGDAVTTAALSARDDIAVRAVGSASTGALTTGTTVDGLGPTDTAGAADTLLGALAGRDIDVVANGLTVGATRALGAGSDARLDGGAGGIGNGASDLDVAADGDITLAGGGARGRDIALSAGGTVSTAALAARDDVAVRAAGTTTTGPVTTGTTVDALGATDGAGAADALMASRSLAGHDAVMFANGLVLGDVDANGSGSSIIINGGAAGVGDGAVDLNLQADGQIVIGSDARARDIALQAAERVRTQDLTARDDVAIKSGESVTTARITTGATADALGPVDAAGAADALVPGRSLAGHDADLAANGIVVGAVRANGSESDIRLNGGGEGVGATNRDLDLMAGKSVVVGSRARGRDIAIVAGKRVLTRDLKARDDIVLIGDDVTHGKLSTGEPVAEDVDGAADAAAGSQLNGQVTIVSEN